MTGPFFKTSFSLFPLFLLALLSLGMILPTPATAADQGETAALAGRIQKRYAAINSLVADYTRSSRFVALGAQGGRDVQGSGRLIWARPLKLRLEQDKPRQELIITGGGMAWWVRPSRKRADLYPLNQFTGGLTSLLDALGGLSRLDKDYEVSLAAPERTGGIPAGSLVLSLQPRVRRADLKELVLWFEPQGLLLKGFAIYNLVGDVTTYRLDQVRVNLPVKASDFAFAPPVDYKVADHRPYRGGGKGQ